jgi:hypothetical protein
MTRKSDLHDRVKAIIDQLSPDELAVLKNCLKFENQRFACSNKPWFSKVQPLFTDKQGTRIPEETLQIVLTLLTERIG